MKKILVSLVLCLMSIATFAKKEVTVKAGTLVPLQVVNPTKADDVKVVFRVSRDINVDGITAIPYGTTVNGTVYEAKKSSWWGTKGRLGIKISEMYGPNGEMIPLTNGDVYVTGKNRNKTQLGREPEPTSSASDFRPLCLQFIISYSFSEQCGLSTLLIRMRVVSYILPVASSLSR